MDGIFKFLLILEDGIFIGYCFRNNGEVFFVNLNVGMGVKLEEIVKNMNIDMILFNCELDGFDISDYDFWLVSN